MIIRYLLTISDKYAIMNVPAYTEPLTRGGELMVHLLNLLISVEAGLLIELIRKWLDGGDNR